MAALLLLLAFLLGRALAGQSRLRWADPVAVVALVAVGLLWTPRQPPVRSRAYTCFSYDEQLQPWDARWGYKARACLQRHTGGLGLYMPANEFPAFAPGRQYLVTVEDLGPP